MIPILSTARRMVSQAIPYEGPRTLNEYSGDAAELAGLMNQCSPTGLRALMNINHQLNGNGPLQANPFPYGSESIVLSGYMDHGSWRITKLSYDTIISGFHDK